MSGDVRQRFGTDEVPGRLHVGGETTRRHTEGHRDSRELHELGQRGREAAGGERRRVDPDDQVTQDSLRPVQPGGQIAERFTLEILRMDSGGLPGRGTVQQAGHSLQAPAGSLPQFLGQAPAGCVRGLD